jgi:hypothetical protein
MVPLQTVVSGVLDFLSAGRTQQCARSSGGSRAAGTRELRALGAFLCGLPEALRFVRERPVAVAPRASSSGSPYASHLSQAGYAAAPVFIAGPKKVACSHRPRKTPC